MQNIFYFINFFYFFFFFKFSLANRMLLRNANRSASLPCTSNSVQLVVTEPRPQDQVPNQHCVLWLVHQWKLAALKMLHQSHQTRHAERVVVAVVVSKRISFTRNQFCAAEIRKYSRFGWFGCVLCITAYTVYSVRIECIFIFYVSVAKFIRNMHMFLRMRHTNL